MNDTPDKAPQRPRFVDQTVKRALRSAGVPVSFSVAVLGISQRTTFLPFTRPPGGLLGVLFLGKALVPRARSPFQRRLNNTRHIPAPGALVPNQTWFVTRGGNTHDFDHLNRFASRASRHIVRVDSLFFLRHERSPMSCSSRVSRLPWGLARQFFQPWA